MSKFKPYDKCQIMLLPPSVEDFIPQGHLARVIEEVVEQLDTSNLEEKYSNLGQKSYSPKLLLKLLYYGYCTGVRSGRKIAMRCETDTAFMYLASMYRPDFRTINDFRKDNLESFEHFFKEVLLMCKSLGMVKAGMVSIDSTKLAANASIGAFRTIQELEEWEQQVALKIKEVIEEADRNDQKEDEEHDDKRGDELPGDLEDLHSLRAKIQEIKNQAEQEGLKKINLTDPDSRVIKSKGGLKTNYNCQTAVDENGIILAGYTSNNASDREQLVKTLQEAESNSEMNFDEVVADAGYASYDNYETMQQMNKTVYIPDQEYKQKKQGDPFHKDHFVYNPQTDTYTCPENLPLVFHSLYRNKRRKQKSRVYIGTQCQLCAKKAQCTKGSHRQVHQELREGLRKEVRDRLATPEGRLKMRQRMHMIESRFGHMKFNLKYDMLMLRGLKKVDAEYKLICTAMNILKLFKSVKHLQLAKAAN